MQKLNVEKPLELSCSWACVESFPLDCGGKKKKCCKKYKKKGKRQCKKCPLNLA